VAKRAALQQKAIDKLLLKCDIDIEDIASAGTETAAARRLANDESKAKSETESAADAEKSSGAATSDVDVVVVEAPPSAIYSCVNELSQDAANYVSVEVDDSPQGQETARDKAAGAVGGLKLKSLSDVKLRQISELSKLNRGAVPQQQKQQFARSQDYFFDQAAERGAIEWRSRMSAESNRPGEASSSITADSVGQKARQLGRGRAWRINEQLGYDFYGTAPQSLTDAPLVKLRSDPLNTRLTPESAQLKAATGAENMRVLLFICPEDMAAPAGTTGIDATK
jgi:hypothetical protein